MVTSVSLLPGSRRRVQAPPLPRAALSRACSTRCRGGAGHEGSRLFWLFMLFHPGRTRILTQRGRCSFHAAPVPAASTLRVACVTVTAGPSAAPAGSARLNVKHLCFHPSHFLSAVLTHLSRGNNLTLLDVCVPGFYTEVV